MGELSGSGDCVGESVSVAVNVGVGGKRVGDGGCNV